LHQTDLELEIDFPRLLFH